MTPVIEKISNVLFGRLQKLAAGYSSNTKVREVIRPKQYEDFTPQHNQIVLVNEDLTIDPELSHPGNPPATAWVATFAINCHVNPSVLHTRSADEFKNYLASDVVKVITKPDSTWHNFNGLAINSTFSPFENIEGDTVVGVKIPLVVTFRTDETSPYIVRA